MKEWYELNNKDKQVYIKQVMDMIDAQYIAEDVNVMDVAKELYESDNFGMLVE